MNQHLIIFSFLLRMSYTHVSSIDDSYNVTITSIKTCSESQTYHISVSSPFVRIINRKIVFSGTFSTDVDLQTPIRADIKVEKKEIGWIELPCIKNLGSCTYYDLCEFGISENMTCPPSFVENDIPCRCPIPKGTYTILPEFAIPLEYYFKNGLTSILTGKYWAKINIDQEGETLACYEIYFSITKTYTKEYI